MLDSRLTTILYQRLKQFPAVALLGPRQVGKTTLAQAVGDQRPSLYLDLESPPDRDKLSDPIDYLSRHADQLVILDEIQRVPALFQSLRVSVCGRRCWSRCRRCRRPRPPEAGVEFDWVGGDGF